jgi:hypothetical protein
MINQYVKASEEDPKSRNAVRSVRISGIPHSCAYSKFLIME